MAETAVDADPYFATTLARGLAVMRAFTPAEESLSNRELAERTGLARPTVSRLARTLVQLGYLRQALTRDRYSLGPAVLELAHPFLANLAVRRIARPLMQRLADAAKGAVSLGMRHGIDLVLVESCQNAQAITARPDVGAVRPMEATAMGYASLAAMAPPERTAVLERCRAAARYDWRTVRARVDAELARFRAHGYCVSRGDQRQGMFAVGVPLGGPTGEPMALNCVVAAYQLKDGELEADLAPRLLALARQVEAALGH
ncbi:MAG: IclR family transcriptional regulator [Burkholderiales bacterium]|nr:IclR family transcriptional regulator [Burkholderiales bacterium]